MNRRSYSFRRIALLIVCMLWLFPTAAFAAGRVDTAKTDCTLTISYQNETTALSDAPFRLYRVADIAAAGADYTAVAPFDRYSVTLNQETNEGWGELAQTLAGYVAADQIAADASVNTGADGTAVFTGLKTGLYLVTGDAHTVGNTIYTPSPVMVSVPGLDETSHDWVYDVTMQAKYTTSTTPNVDSLVRRVTKVWSDSGYEGHRPESIEVQLLRDGAVYDTVTLSAANNWRHEWSGLDAKSSWQIVEVRVPDGYTVSTTLNGDTFVITNTYHHDTPGGGDGGGGGGGGGEEHPPTPPTQPTPPSEQPTIPGGHTPEETSRIFHDNVQNIVETIFGENVLGYEDIIGGRALPQTGQLWWPVPLLACAGMLLFGLGWFRRRNGEQER